jgi:hypothetical protein
MKWILAPILWALAVIAALAVLYRIWRGHNVVLTGRWSPRFIRMVVIVLVVLGVGVEKTRSAPVPGGKAPTSKPDGELPGNINEKTIEAWTQAQVPTGNWAMLKKELTLLQLAEKKIKDGGGPPGGRTVIGQLIAALPPHLQLLMQEEIKVHGEGGKVPRASFADLNAALDESEKQGIYDHWLAAYLWRRGGGEINDDDRKAAVRFYTRLQEHARLANTILAAQARVKPLLMPPRAWMSKAGPPPGAIQAHRQGIADMLVAVKWLYPRADLGTWQNDGCVLLTNPKDGETFMVHRGGEGDLVDRGVLFRFGRLDLVQTADKKVKLEHTWLGTIELPEKSLISVWDLPKYLSAEARKKIEEAIDDALDGSEPAARKLEQALPFAQALLRARLQKSAEAKGASRLRLILSLFDDAPMPLLPLSVER